ncbi:MAG: glycosyltransferase family 2 protein [Methylococcus sp.]|nr:MAG: glycosyltransferase family 2 protein [Methylococcus sp.]
MATPSAAPTITVIIVNHNGGNHLFRCLEGLRQQTREANRIVVVDNDSRDQPVTGGEPWLAGVDLIHSDSNLGFAAANNLAVARCPEAEWIALLNPDAVPAADWLAELDNATRQFPGYDCFACRQLDAAQPERLDGAGDGLTRAGRPFRRGYGQTAVTDYTVADEVFSACGAAMLIRRALFLEVGGFDTDFFCYLEDVDLGYRLRLNGHRCRYVPTAVVHHEGSALTGWRSDFSTYHGHRNLEWLFIKNTPGWLFWRYLPGHLLLNVAALVRCARRGQLRIFLKAKVDALRGVPVMWRKRRGIQASRTASLGDIHLALSSDCPVTVTRRGQKT